MSICIRNVVEICPEVAEIQVVSQPLHGRHLENIYTVVSYNCIYIFKMAAVGHLGINFPSFWTSHNVNLGGLHFFCQWRNDLI